MESIRKILLINVFGLVIIFIALSSYAGMGGGHHGASHMGNVGNMPYGNNSESDRNSHKFNNNQGMHGESGWNNKNNHDIQEDMMHNDLHERNSRSYNSDKMPGQDMGHQQHFDEMDRD